MYFYNYDTGRNDLIEEKQSYTADELKPYLSPANTLTVKYVSEGTNEYGWDRQLRCFTSQGGKNNAGNQRFTEKIRQFSGP